MDAERAWDLWMRSLRRYHRHEVEGLDRLLAAAPCLAVGYHGRGLPIDLGLLAHRIWRDRGYKPCSVVHDGIFSLPVLGEFFTAIGCIGGESEPLRAAVARGEVAFLAPGGTREGLRSARARYRVDWGPRRGYLRLACELGAPLVPVASVGMDDRYLGLNDGHALGKRLGLPGRFPLWFALGPAGLYPFTPGFPVKIRTRVGEPIPLDAGGEPRPDDPGWLDAMHARVSGAVQGLLDEMRG